MRAGGFVCGDAAGFEVCEEAVMMGGGPVLYRLRLPMANGRAMDGLEPIGLRANSYCDVREEGAGVGPCKLPVRAAYVGDGALRFGKGSDMVVWPHIAFRTSSEPVFGGSTLSKRLVSRCCLTRLWAL